MCWKASQQIYAFALQDLCCEESMSACKSRDWLFEIKPYHYHHTGKLY